ncbi:MAG TPA: aminotransferase class V-fold PLP-dependent enzyme [Caulobacteraceae bacterium]|jgi:selenocysteine lyase/cysteine desulfurase|nr:aminotransferase class V-fold PLP-dependent enzyme [Caulobacteraceae bacterium]
MTAATLAQPAALAFDPAAFRARFPTLKTKTYMNSGSYGLLAQEVQDAFAAYLDARLRCGSEWGWWVERAEAVRAGMAELLRVSGDTIAVTASASAGVNAVASALDFSGKDGRNKVVVSNFEFPTSGQIWHAQQPRGAEIVHVPEDAAGYIPLEHFEKAIDERTKLVAIAHVCYRNGAKQDVKGIVEIARRHGAMVLLDIYQAVGVTDIDLKALDVDFATGGMLKYLLGTAGIGFFYAREDRIRELLPTVTGWFAQRDIFKMDIFANDPSPTARRFEMGTPPVPNCYAAEAGIGIINGIGTAPIEAYVRDLTTHAIERLAEIGCKFAMPVDPLKRGPQITIKSLDDHALVEKLAARDIVVSNRDGNVRCMFHAYNDMTDVDALIAGLEANRALLR